ncbi:MAG: peptidoglycan DD-metalloendopeptidase family protein [Alphaproteobacteria bacterium]
MLVRSLVRSTHAIINRTFEERQFFIRAGSRVRFLAVSRRQQIALAVLLVGFAVWSLYASVVYFSYDARLAASEARYARVRLAYERASDERDTVQSEAREAYRGVLASLMKPFEVLDDARLESRQELAALRGRNAKLVLEMTEIAREIVAARAERDRLTRADASLVYRYDVLESELVGLRNRNSTLDGNVASLQGELAAGKSRERAIEWDNGALSEALSKSKREIADAQRRNETAAAKIAKLEENLTGVAGERDKASDQRTALARHVDELEQRLASLQSDQDALVARLSERAKSHNVAVEHTIAMTGLDVGKLMAQVEKNSPIVQRPVKPGVGGPFVAYRPELVPFGKTSLHSSEIELVVATLDKQEERREGLNRVLAHLPLASPIDDYRVMSDFGKRIDPINGRLAMHEGVDLTSEPGAPVLATAPGIVTFAGWNGSYGKMVEIDHGMGVRTRYAHLKSVVVETGHKVAARTEVGIMGSTGRSTGTHVHYEILVDEQHYNPMNFIKAGDYVFSKN